MGIIDQESSFSGEWPPGRVNQKKQIIKTKITDLLIADLIKVELIDKTRSESNCSGWWPIARRERNWPHLRLVRPEKARQPPS